MQSKAKYFSRKIGIVLNTLGTLQMVPLIFSLVTRELRSITFGYLFSILVTFSIGAFLIRFGRNGVYKPDKWSGLVLAALIAILLVFPASLPYLFIQKVHWSKAVFEAASGITTTGLTVFSNLSQLPDSLLLYRAITQWFGGALFLVFFVLVGFRSEDQFLLGYSNTLNLFKIPKQISTLNKGVLVFLVLYTLFTFVETLLYCLIGVPLFDAFAHSLTTVSAGGFSTFENGLIEGMGFEGIKSVLLISCHSTFMLFSGISYFLFVKAVTFDFKAIFKNNELRIYFGLIIVATLLMVLINSMGSNSTFAYLENGFLMVVGAVSSVGIYSGGYRMTDEIVFILLTLVAIGGMIGSTAGGIKINRMRVVIHSIKYESDHIFKPSQVVSALKLDGKPIDTKVVLKLMTLVISWFIIALFSWLFIRIVTDLQSSSVIISVISALANGGFVDSGIVDYSQISALARVGYVIIMIVGRLEIYPILVLFHLKAWKY